MDIQKVEPTEDSKPDINSIRSGFEAAKKERREKDAKMDTVDKARRGDWEQIAPDLFPDDDFSKPIISNQIDTIARDLATSLSPLPTFSCTTTNMSNDSARDRASRKTKIIQGYVSNANLSQQMIKAADRMPLYGFTPIKVEIDWDKRIPTIRFVDPKKSYYKKDEYQNISSFYEYSKVNADVLIQQYPEQKAAIDNMVRQQQDKKDIDVVFSHDKDWDAVIAIPSSELAYKMGARPTLLGYHKNVLNKVMVRVPELIISDDIPKGWFDDLIYPLLAKNTLALYTIAQIEENLEAPIVGPMGMGNVKMGRNSIIETNDPKSVHRLQMNGSTQEAFFQQQQLTNEINQGANYPAARTGNTDASVVTGQGLKQLDAPYYGQVKRIQGTYGIAFTDIIGLMLELDVKIFGDEKKTLAGSDTGTPFVIEYTPNKDIKDDFTVTVRYGLGAGLDASQWGVWMLQMKSADVVSNQYIRENSPFDLDQEREERQITMESIEKATLLGLQGMAQSIPAVAQQGGDILQIVGLLSKVATRINKGESVLTALEKASTPEEDPKQAQQKEMSDQQGDMLQQLQDGDVSQLPQGLNADGTTKGVPAGQQGEAPGTKPALQSLLASLDSNGRAQASASISSRRAI